MPKVAMNYQNTIIYKIVCKDLSITDCYVGSTTNFTKRKCHHKNSCNNINDKAYNYNVYNFIRAKCGWENWDMIEIEKYPCNDFNEALKRERYWIETLKATLNKVIPTRTKKEHYEDNKIDILKKQKDNYEENKIIILAKHKEYYENNKVTIVEREKKKYQRTRDVKLQYQKQYALEHSDKIKEYRKQYAKDNADKIQAYREANADKIKAYREAYREANADKRKEYMKQYRLKKKKQLEEKTQSAEI